MMRGGGSPGGRLPMARRVGNTTVIARNDRHMVAVGSVRGELRGEARRDLDNLLKGLLDALTHAGLWLDDSQVADLRIRRAPTIGGMVKVRVTPC